jgi:hypothetical protein
MSLQATEWIVDTALAHGKGFAVVPCCVFADLFGRRDGQGRRVSTYASFVDYLLAKDARIQRAWLPFEGKNTVLFLRPPATGVEHTAEDLQACVECVPGM